MLNSLAGALREAGMNYDNRNDPDFYRYLVKAVLERMKEPTLDMLNDADIFWRKELANECYQAMINAALK